VYWPRIETGTVYSITVFIYCKYWEAMDRST